MTLESQLYGMKIFMKAKSCENYNIISIFFLYINNLHPFCCTFFSVASPEFQMVGEQDGFVMKVQVKTNVNISCRSFIYLPIEALGSNSQKPAS